MLFVVVEFVERVVQRQFVRQQFGQFLRVEFGEFERVVQQLVEQQFVGVEFVEQFVGLAEFVGKFVERFVRFVLVEFVGQQLVVVLGQFVERFVVVELVRQRRLG